MSFYRKIAISMAVMAMFCVNQACKKDNNSGGTVAPPAPKHDIRLAADAKFGSILTDSTGLTLYFFSNDAADTSTCYGGCATAWPVFYAANPTLDDSLAASDFGVITRNDGSKQTTYKGWPLYYYQADAKAGDINGDGVGKIWFVAKPDYSVMLSNTQLVGNDGVKYDSLLTPGTGKTLYVTDAWGHTLYAFSHDTFKKNNFTKSDFSNNAVWPIDTVARVMKAPSLLDHAQLDTLAVFGKVQLVYKGWPLYYFGNDAGVRGSNKGIAFPAAGIWPYVNANSPLAP